MSERDLSADDIRAEHLDDVDERVHWIYLFVVLGVGTMLMLGLIGLLDLLG
jgi:hypothetical protein